MKADTMDNYYNVLGVTAQATEKEIKAVYRKLAKQYHPDAVKDNPQMAEKMYEIQAAYEVLGVEEKRRKYDESLRRQVKKNRDRQRSDDRGETQNPSTTEFERFFGFQPGKGMGSYKGKQTNAGQTGEPVNAEALFAAFFGKKK